MTEVNQLTAAERNKFASILQYYNAVPAVLEKFFPAKQLLMEEAMADPEGYSVKNILVSNEPKKAFSKLQKKYIGDSRIKDCCKEGNLPEQVIPFLKSLECIGDGNTVQIKTNMDWTGEVYLYISRGNHMSIKNTVIKAGTVFDVQNRFNCYGTEAFVLAFRSPEFYVSITPAALDGVKGKNDVFIFVKDETGVYRDYADNYFNVDACLALFRG